MRWRRMTKDNTNLSAEGEKKYSSAASAVNGWVDAVELELHAERPSKVPSQRVLASKAAKLCGEFIFYVETNKPMLKAAFLETSGEFTLIKIQVSLSEAIQTICQGIFEAAERLKNWQDEQFIRGQIERLRFPPYEDICLDY